jgi:hypothetical protein
MDYHLYELPFDFEFLEPSRSIQWGFSLQVCWGEGRYVVGMVFMPGVCEG